MIAVLVENRLPIIANGPQTAGRLVSFVEDSDLLDFGWFDRRRTVALLR